jgi:outer membrane protein OmpA-like peptidoglycan-associated protein
LSEYRAKAALNYLISKGIEGSRIKAVGKGETEFIAVNTYPDGRDNPKGRRFNRRVEFEISGTDTSLVIERIDPVPPELKTK